MTSLETYQKIHEYKKLGLSKRKIGMNLGISVATVTKWWDATEDDFLNAEKTRFHTTRKVILLTSKKYCKKKWTSAESSRRSNEKKQADFLKSHF